MITLITNDLSATPAELGLCWLIVETGHQDGGAGGRAAHRLGPTATGQQPRANGLYCNLKMYVMVPSWEMGALGLALKWA